MSNYTWIEGIFTGTQITGNSTTINYENGTIYSGIVNEIQEPHGFGKLTFADGQYIVGEFNKGGFTGGTGYINLPDGTIYSGDCGPGMVAHGIGKIEGNGITIEGEFIEGNFQGGSGTIQYTDGPFYEGGVNKDRQPHGKGIYHYTKHVHKISGSFRYGVLVPGQASISYSNGSHYKGLVDGNGSPNGFGRLEYNEPSNFAPLMSNYTWIEGIFTGTQITGNALFMTYGRYWEGPVDKNLNPHGNGRCKSSENAIWNSCSYDHGVLR